MIPSPLLLLFASVLLTSEVSSGESTVGGAVHQDQAVGESELYDAPDTTNSGYPDTVGAGLVDTLVNEEAVRRDLFSGVLQPLALSAILGGLLLLIFTQRGR